MSLWVVGEPGCAARLLLASCSEEEASRQIHDGEVLAEVSEVAEYLLPKEGGAPQRIIATAQQLALELRAARNARLADSDKFMMPDFPLSDAERRDWVAYRQALRDIPEQQPGVSLNDVAWPSLPAAAR